MISFKSVHPNIIGGWVFDNFIINIKNGFRVANATRKLVFSDKQLFIYPIIATLISIAIAVLVLGALLAAYIAGSFAGLTTGELAFVVLIVFIILYFLTFVVTTFFTVAMLLAFREHGKKNRISISDALTKTEPYTKLIIEWSAFYTIIVTIIHLIESAIRSLLSRYGVVGNVISGLFTGGLNLGLAAAVAFSLPVIIDEKKGPVATMKSSINFIMKNFGDTFGGLLFAEIFQIVFLLFGLGLIFLGIIAMSATNVALLGIVLALVGVVVIIAGVLLRYVLFNCFKLIVYDYKTRGTLPKGFDAKLIDNSINRKNNPKGGKFGVSTLGVGTGEL